MVCNYFAPKFDLYKNTHDFYVYCNYVYYSHGFVNRPYRPRSKFKKKIKKVYGAALINCKKLTLLKNINPALVYYICVSKSIDIPIKTRGSQTA